MSSSNYCFLTCIQVSQEAGQVIWYSHLLKNFPQFALIHTVKGFGIPSLSGFHSPGHYSPASVTSGSDTTHLKTILAFSHSSAGKESACDVGDPGSIPGSGRSRGEGIGYPLQCSWASLVTQLVKKPPAVQETCVQSLGWEDPLEKGKATHSSILAWRIPWTYSPWGHKESDKIEWLSLSFRDTPMTQSLLKLLTLISLKPVYPASPNLVHCGKKP